MNSSSKRSEIEEYVITRCEHLEIKGWALYWILSNIEYYYTFLLALADADDDDSFFFDDAIEYDF